MTDKKPTVAALLRKVEKLEARLAVADGRLDEYMRHYRSDLYERVDAQTRIDQAMAILKGEE